MPTTVKNLGNCRVPSPLVHIYSGSERVFVNEERRVAYSPYEGPPEHGELKDISFERAGPRRKLYFAPGKVRSAIVTCGGLCPGLNAVIRAIVMESTYRYGAADVIGIRFGYRGLRPDSQDTPMRLTPEIVDTIHLDGGTILGSSRGGTEEMESLVDSLERLGVNILYTIGGDGTLRGAHKIATIAVQRGLDLVVVGVPKTIDNDISYISRSFGFETAFSKAVDSIYSAHVEAKGAPNGIGLVKLMGRHSGFIAANAALAMNDANFVLIPEVPFDLDGNNGFLAHLRTRMERRAHAVICVAEGAGQEMMKAAEGGKRHDASGNVALEDIGVYLKNRIVQYFSGIGMEINLKYIDPSYIIRSAPPVPNDSIFCGLLGQYAVHAGMAGKTDVVIGMWNNVYTHVPIELAISKRKTIDPSSRFWYNVIEATGQPLSMVN